MPPKAAIVDFEKINNGNQYLLHFGRQPQMPLKPQFLIFSKSKIANISSAWPCWRQPTKPACTTLSAHV
jgi:hypothetical protein